MAVNQPNFELSNSYNFLFRIIQVLKIKVKKKNQIFRFIFKKLHKTEMWKAYGNTLWFALLLQNKSYNTAFMNSIKNLVKMQGTLKISQLELLLAWVLDLAKYIN